MVVVVCFVQWVVKPESGGVSASELWMVVVNVNANVELVPKVLLATEALPYQLLSLVFDNNE